MILPLPALAFVDQKSFNVICKLMLWQLGYLWPRTKRASGQGRGTEGEDRLHHRREPLLWLPAYPCYRRIHAEIAEDGIQEERVNHKRIRRVLGDYELGLRRFLPKSKPSAVSRVIKSAGPSADLVKGHSFAPLKAFSTDFTELVYDGGSKKAHLRPTHKVVDV